MSKLDIHVAVVDDDESLCRSMERLLRAAHLQPEVFASAEAFLAHDRRAEFDCLVLDIQLEGMSGLELHEALATAGDRTPVIFITAHDAPAIHDQAWRGGCAGFFRKTEPGEHLLAAIHRAVAAHRAAPPPRPASERPASLPTS